MIRRVSAFGLGGISAGLILVLLYANFFSLPPILEKNFKKFELQTVDYRMKFSSHPDVSKVIKIVLVDDVSNLSDKLATFTKLISTVAGGRYKPKVLGFNYLFDSPTVNEALIAATSAAGNVYYGYNFLLVAPQTNPAAANQDILPFRLEITDVGNGMQKSLEARDVQLPSTKYLATARGIGFVNTPPDISDNVCRRVPLFLSYQGNRYGSLALLMALKYLAIESVDITFYPGEYLEVVQDDGGFIKIPVNQYGQMLIDFAYDAAVGGVAPFETFSMEKDILMQVDKIDQLPESSPLARLKDAIVLVGSGSQASPALQPIPLTKPYPLVGIHANVINNLLTNHFARELGLDFTVGLVVLLSMLTGLIISERRFISKVIFTVGIAGLYLLMAYGIFFQFRLLLPILSPLLALGLTVVSVGGLVRYKPKLATQQAPQQPLPEKKRKTKVSSDDLSSMENELIEIREELDRKSFRLRSKTEELRLLQESGETNHYDSGQVAALQKEIRAREIEIKSLALKEEEIRRQVENLPFIDGNIAQVRQNPEKLARFFAKYGFITANERLLYTLQRVEKLSKTSVTLLIQGEPGTGKNLLAKTIKELSSRHNRPMLEIICAGDMELLEDDLFGHKRGAFPGAEEPRNGYFKEVDGGTLVLEEIENLSLEIQTKLIQALRGKVVRPIGDDRGYPIDVRVIATTAQDLRKLVAAGKFREDVYHYFSVFPAYLPPLRERKEDIPPLVKHLIQKYDRVHSKIIEVISDAAMNLLVTHQWPGNVAELEKVIERAISEANPGAKELPEKNITFEEADLAGGIEDPGMLNYLIALLDSDRELPSYQQVREKVLVEIQRLYCARLLRGQHGNVKSAAIAAGLKEDTLKKMLTELMIDPENYRM